MMTLKANNPSSAKTFQEENHCDGCRKHPAELHEGIDTSCWHSMGGGRVAVAEHLTVISLSITCFAVLDKTLHTFKKRFRLRASG